MQGSCEITNTTRGTVPRLPFCEMKEAVLGKGYTLSLVVCGDSLARKLNRTYRNKDYEPNVLSFPLDREHGEIFLNVRKLAREAKKEGVTARHHIAHLFIHSCYHLKGYDHSDEMDALERKTLKKFRF